MKKLFSKVVTVLAAVVMAVCLLPAMSVHAAQNYYIVGNDDAFANWSEGSAPQMTASESVYTYTFAADVKKTYEFQILPQQGSWDGQIGNEGGGNFKMHALGSGNVTVKFDPSKSGNERISFTNADFGEAATVYDKYYITGTLDDLNWAAESAPEMTKSGDVFTYVFNGKKDIKVEFKILPAQSWAVSFGTEANGNFEYTPAADGKGTITWDPYKNGDARVSVTYVADQQNGGNTGSNNNSGSSNNAGSNTNAGANTNASTNTESNTTTTDDGKVYIYVKPDSSWGDEVYLYAWKDSADENYPNEGAWPGKKMTKLSDGWFRLEITAKSDRIIFNNGEGKTQTADITIEAGKSHSFTVAADGTYKTTDIPKMGDVNALPFVLTMVAGLGVVGFAVIRRRKAA